MKDTRKVSCSQMKADAGPEGWLLTINWILIICKLPWEASFRQARFTFDMLHTSTCSRKVILGDNVTDQVCSVLDFVIEPPTSTGRLMRSRDAGR